MGSGVGGLQDEVEGREGDPARQRVGERQEGGPELAEGGQIGPERHFDERAQELVRHPSELEG